MASSSSDTSFKGWILATIGAIIVGVAVPVLIKQFNPDRPVPEHTIISIGGRVFDETAKRVLENVLVRLRVETQQEQQNTDSEGRYAFSLENFDPRIAGTIVFEAAGYQPRSYNLQLQAMNNLDPSLSVLAAQPTPQGTAHGGRGLVITHALTQYVKRADFKQLTAVKH